MTGISLWDILREGRAFAGTLDSSTIWCATEPALSDAAQGGAGQAVDQKRFSTVARGVLGLSSELTWTAF